MPTLCGYDIEQNGTWDQLLNFTWTNFIDIDTFYNYVLVYCYDFKVYSYEWRKNSESPVAVC